MYFMGLKISAHDSLQNHDNLCKGIKKKFLLNNSGVSFAQNKQTNANNKIVHKSRSFACCSIVVVAVIVVAVVVVAFSRTRNVHVK